MSLFTDALQRLVSQPPYEGRHGTMAKAAGINRGFFHHVLNGKQGATPRFVGRLCAILDRAQSADLLQAYLQTVAAEVHEATAEESKVSPINPELRQKRSIPSRSLTIHKLTPRRAARLGATSR